MTWQFKTNQTKGYTNQDVWNRGMYNKTQKVDQDEQKHIVHCKTGMERPKNIPKSNHVMSSPNLIHTNIIFAT
ncbi:hypothetical protein FRX31_004560 [Thalictrum thalictroides]|uniref:Uncharacterized protein n=1 Tax=Thalictrum thalictroides TaxID=46969 RepID=A0A7J6X808_THATH|nr:hypothetical protein FRX31_004560 [Thalictrum thalictroides]